MATKTVIVGSEAQLMAALQAATGDTEIRLKAGTYSTVRISNYNPAFDVSIVSDSATSQAVIDQLTVTGSSNLTFEALKFNHQTKATDFTGWNQVAVFSSHDVSFVNVDVSSKVDNIAGNDVSGIRINNSDNVAVLNSKFHDLRSAVFTEWSDNVILAGNDVRKVREGFDIAGSDNLTIDRNLFTDFKTVIGDHPDAIQVWTTNSVGSNNLEITNNAFLFGAGVYVQGVLIRSERGDVARHSDITIANNAYLGQSRHGLTVSDADNVYIGHNTVLSATKTATSSSQYLDPAINTTNTTGAVVDSNISALMFSQRDVGLVATNNIDAWDSRGFGGYTAQQLFGHTFDKNTTAAGFVTKPGSVAYLADAGFEAAGTIGRWASVTQTLVDSYLGQLPTAGDTYQIV